LVTAAAAWLSSGCAFKNVEVYPPQHEASRTPNGRGRGREVIVVALFDDRRSGKEAGRCGMQMNGYRMDTADVVCQEPPGRWLADALAMKLTADGYRVLDGDAQPGPSTIVVHGTVRRLFLEPHDGFFTRTVEGDFSVRLVVTSASGLRAERTFYVKGTDEHIGSFQSVFQAAANEATERIASAMTSALGELLERYPELGAPEATKRVAWSAPASARSR
jgi:hypothetical protein